MSDGQEQSRIAGDDEAVPEALPAMPSILARGRSPADWVSIFAEKGLAISERTLRAKARALGACYVIGKAMIITPEQIDAILESSIRPPKHGRASPAATRPATHEQVMAHLKRRAQRAEPRNGRAARSRE